MGASRVSADPHPGQAIGPYRLEARLGRGGMGEVWSATYAGRRGFAKQVALKLLRTPRFDSETALMFVDEARAAGQLSHPAVVPTFDLGRHGPYAYIAMELVTGASLNVLLARVSRQGLRLSAGAVAYIGERIASALDYGYRRAQSGGQPLRLVHRDVSPHNVLVDLSGAVRLTDFGIARTAIQEHVTAVGKFRGKPGYLSPEQVSGQPLDDRSDVFSLCIVLWECATGRRLFSGESLADSVAATLRSPAPRLTTQLRGFPLALSDVIARGLQKRPEDRPNSQQLAEALRETGADLATGERELGLLLRSVEPAPSREASPVRSAPLRPLTPARDARPTTRRMSEIVSIITRSILPPTPWLKAGLLTVSLLGAAVAGYGARDVVEALASTPAPAVARPPVPTPAAAQRVARPPPLIEPATAATPRTASPAAPRTASPAAQPPSTHTQPELQTTLDGSPRPPPAAPTPSPWASLERLTTTEPQTAARLRADLTEAIASGRPDLVRAVASEIHAELEPR